MNFLTLQKNKFCVLLALGLAAVACAATTRAGDDAPLVLTRAQLLITPVATPPQSTAGWQAVTLPDTWPVSRYMIADNGWYRFVIHRAQRPSELWGIYLPRLNMNAAVYFNGEFLGDGGSFEQPLGRNWSRPLYFKIPGAVWKQGDNVLDIRLRSDAGVGMLAPVTIGSHGLVSGVYDQAYFFHVQLNEGLFILTLAVAFFFFSLWLKRRNDTQYGWFALTALVWSLLSLNHFISTIPVSAINWDWLMFSGIAWWTTGLAMFVHRYIGYRHATLEAALIGYALSAMVLYAVAGSYLWVVAAAWMAGSIVIGGYVVWRLLKHSRLLQLAPRAPQPQPGGALPVSAREAAWLGSGIAGVLLVGIHDWMVQNDIFFGVDDSYAYHHLLPYSAPLLFIFIGWHLNQRFVEALNQSDQLNLQLETRIAANRLELEGSYQKLRELERASVLTHERERIYRDLHDGLGGITTNISLLSNLAQQEEPPPAIRKKLATIAELSREGLDEIRSFMRELDDQDADWQSVAADLRIQGSNLLEPHGIEFKFDAVLQNGGAAADSVLRINLFRIYKEALTNVIKHAQAKKVAVNICVSAQQLLLAIKDDGIGLQGDSENGQASVATANGGGHGLGNLKARAQRLGGVLSLYSDAGTEIRLQVPLPLKYPEPGMAQ